MLKVHVSALTFFIVIFTVPNKILIASGLPGGDSRDNSEVLDLMDNSLSCQNLAPLVVKTYSATGSLVDGVPLICGGEHGSRYDECYKITKSVTSVATYMKARGPCPAYTI